MVVGGERQSREKTGSILGKKEGTHDLLLGHWLYLPNLLCILVCFLAV